MSEFLIINKHGVRRLSIKEPDGITVGDLKKILSELPAAMDESPVCLYIKQLASCDSVIVEACNEPDLSVFWLKVDEELHDLVGNQLH